MSLLGGLVNVQPTLSSTGLDYGTTRAAFVEQLDPAVTALDYMLENSSNIGVFDGKVTFTDGGDAGIESLMQTQPDAIRQALGSLTLRLASKA